MRELVGQGKPFYSSLDKAAGLLRRKVGTGSEFLKELMSIPGVKQAEIAERGLGELLNAPKMTHEQFMAALSSKPAPAIGEKVLGEGPDPKDVIRAANAHARTSALNYAESADTSREARQMRADELRRLREYHRPQIMEFAKSELEDTNLPHHEQYTLPGGENYREMLIKAPKDKQRQEHEELRKAMQKKYGPAGANSDFATPEDRKKFSESVRKSFENQNEQFPGVSAHFGGEPGILASMRLKDRTGPNGEKLLHLEELQSDWHQQGREKGYRGEQKKTDWDDPEYVAARKRSMELNNEFNKNSDRPDRQAEIEPMMREAQNAERAIVDRNNKIGKLVPDAPFKKNWEEMALKRLIHHAAENGYHDIVVTPGAEQADRYSLAKHISGVDYIRNELKPHRNEMIAYDPKGNVIFNEFGVTPEKLEQHIGKETAQKLLSQEPQPNQYGLPTHSLRGEQLVVGGEGMKAFYDKKVPNILNGIGKKYGVKTELGGHNIPINNGMLEPQEGGGYKQTPPETKPLHYFPITEEMRQDVKQNGIPLYKSGGTVSTH